MSPGSRGPVVVDTGVFAARLTPSGSLLAARYRPVLEGRPAVISFVTVAELGSAPAWLGGGRGGSDGWITRLHGGQRSCGRGHTLSRHMRRSGHGVSGAGTVWARRSMRCLPGSFDLLCH